MKKSNILSLLNNPYFLTLLISLPLILSFLFSIKEFQAETILTTYETKKDEVNFWADVNGDGNYEQIQTFHNNAGNAAVNIRDGAGNAMGQWNLKSRFQSKIYTRRILIGDLNGDELDDLALITQDSNFIFLNIICPMNREEIIVKHFFIDSIRHKNGQFDFGYNIFPRVINMYPGSGPQILFWIDAGFSRTPRKVYLFSIQDSSLLKSQNLSYAGISQVIDLDGDGFKELLPFNSSPGNDPGSDKVFPNDHYTWLAVLDHKLKLKFPPVQLGRTNSGLVALAENTRDSFAIVTGLKEMYYDTMYYHLHLFDSKGNELKNRLLRKNPDKFCDFIILDSSMIFTEGETIYKVGANLSLKKLAKMPNQQNPHYLTMRNNYFVGDNHLGGFLYETNEVFLTTRNFKDLINLHLIKKPKHAFSLTRIEDWDGKVQFAIQAGDETKKIIINETMLYKFRIPIAGFIYLVILGLVMLTRKIQEVQFNNRVTNEKRIAVLRARSLKNLIDPHFTLNTLNAISGLVKNHSRDQASDYITKFSRMIYNLLSRSDELFTPLGKEMEFVKDYLDIQQLRFPNLFAYKIDFTEDVKLNRLIPKILIQTIVENAIRHGIRPKGSDGLLIIRILIEQKLLKVIVEDNGIGRKAALELDTTHTGTGLKVIYQLIDILKYHADEAVQFHTEDLLDENDQAAGTRVEVLLPEFRESVWEE